MISDQSSPAADGLTADAYYREGLDCRNREHRGEAMEMFRQALLREPSHRESLLAMGALLGDLGRWQDAQRVYEHALRRFPENERIAGLLTRARAGVRQAPFVKPIQSTRFEHRGLKRRGTIVGFLSFGLVVYTYITVGLATHFTVGLAAAGVVAGLVAPAGTLLFPRHRGVALRAIARGMAYGLAATAVVGLVSILIALAIATSDAGAAVATEDPRGTERSISESTLR